MTNLLRSAVLLRCGCSLALAGLSSLAWGQAQGIYSCVDARGRNLKADRPIAECLDREQKILNPSGTLRATIGPTLTANERAEQEARRKRDADELVRLEDEKRRDRAMLKRYPNQAAHDQARLRSLAQLDVDRQTALKRAEKLQQQRDGALDELEFYKKDPAKAPAALRRQLDELERSVKAHARVLAAQEEERKATTARLDEELSRLKKLWQLPPAAAGKPP